MLSLWEALLLSMVVIVEYRSVIDSPAPGPTGMTTRAYQGSGCLTGGRGVEA